MRITRALDALNSAFLFADSGFLLHGLWQLSHAGDARAISLPQYLFFTVWQLFGVGYYAHLGKRWSVIASVFVSIVLIIFSMTVWYFQTHQAGGAHLWTIRFSLLS